MKLFRTLLFLCVMAVAATADPITITFTQSPGQTAGGYYVGYTTATLQTATQTFPDFSLICADFTHTTSVPSGPYTFNVSTLDDLSNVRWQGPNMLLNYQIAAILLYDYDGLAPNDQSDQAGDYNFALWNVFNPAATPNYGNSLALIASATTVVAGGGISEAYENFRIFTPTGNATSNQEFLGTTSTTFGNPGEVPEPTTSALMGLGLIGIALINRRR